MPQYDPKGASKQDEIIRRILEIDLRNKEKYYSTYSEQKNQKEKEEKQQQQQNEPASLGKSIFGKISSFFGLRAE
jgi:ATPase subunit of ABC transporter with duplicated ATPase domains